jgi:hypothetical protein
MVSIEVASGSAIDQAAVKRAEDEVGAARPDLCVAVEAGGGVDAARQKSRHLTKVELLPWVT